MHLLNDPAPWWGSEPPSPYSIVDLIASDTVSPDVAGVMWWMVERGASVIVAAGPRGVGKTTLASTLFGFLPEDAAVYITSGPDDPLTLPSDRNHTWLFVNELSDHVPTYLSGDAALQAFGLVRGGASIVASLHASSVAAIGPVLERDAGVPADRAKLVDLGLVLTVTRNPGGIVRHVTEAALLRDRDQPVPLAEWNAAQTGLALTEDGLAALADWSGVAAEQARAQIQGRAAHLVATGRRGVHTREDVQASIQYFRRTRNDQHGQK